MSTREKKISHYDVVIIGGGAAGLTAGIYCGRAKLKTLLIEKSLMGGLATYTNEIENYPGFPEGSSGIDLMNLFHKQAKKFGVEFKMTDVKAVDFSGEEKVVETFRDKYIAKAVVIASGGRPRTTGAINEELFLYDKGISFCATCDAAANTDKTVMVIGSGDAAIEEGMFLSKFAKKVIVSVMHDTGKMDCNEIAKAAALANNKMEFIWNSVAHEFKGEERLNTVVLRNVKTNELMNFDVDSCFEFIGYIPNTEIFKGIVDMTNRGNILVNDKMETNVEGVFSVGDVNEKFLKQVATAVGDGAVGGYSVEKYIAETEVYEEQILTEVTSVAYVYNAIEAKDREYLATIEEVELKHSFRVNRIDTYKSMGLANRLGVKSPAVVIVKDKKIVNRMEGFPKLDEILNQVK